MRGYDYLLLLCFVVRRLMTILSSMGDVFVVNKQERCFD